MNVSQAREVADRAGSLVTDHVRAVIDAAQATADDLQRDTDKDAQEIRSGAHQAGRGALSKIDSAEQRLRTLVATLREEADTVSDGNAADEAAH